MGKKYPKKRRMSFFDYVLMMIAWSIWVVIMGMAIYGQLTENPGINMIVYMAICMIVSMSIGIYLKPREYSYVQLKEDGIYWKSVWGRTYVYFPWEDVEQAGFAQAVSLTMVNDLDSAAKGAIQSKADTMAYVSTK
ncbi:MAG: hypothetical protein ACLUR9_09540 [Christensenellales bacterium]